jgi:hypothetical protein
MGTAIHSCTHSNKVVTLFQLTTQPATMNIINGQVAIQLQLEEECKDIIKFLGEHLDFDFRMSFTMENLISVQPSTIKLYI